MRFGMFIILASAGLLASCGQTREEERATAAKAEEKAVAPEMVRVGEEEFCDGGTVRFRQMYSNDGGVTKSNLGVRTPEPRVRC